MNEKSLGAATGNVGDVIRLQSRSAASCQLTGYPGLVLISPRGDELRTVARAAFDGSYLFPAVAARRVALAPGDYASFEIGYTDNTSGVGNSEPYSVACPSAAWLRVRLPGTHQYGTVTAPLAPCEGVIDVAPLVAGLGWAGS